MNETRRAGSACLRPWEKEEGLCRGCIGNSPVLASHVTRSNVCYSGADARLRVSTQRPCAAFTNNACARALSVKAGHSRTLGLYLQYCLSSFRTGSLVDSRSRCCSPRAAGDCIALTVCRHFLLSGVARKRREQWRVVTANAGTALLYFYQRGGFLLRRRLFVTHCRDAEASKAAAPCRFGSRRSSCNPATDERT